MTMEELDNALTRLGLDLNSVNGLKIKSMIVGSYGQTILNSKKTRCERCWMKEHNQCGRFWCDIKDLPKDPIEVGNMFIERRNDIVLFPFVVKYVIPIYEEITGNKNTIEGLRDEFKKRWKLKMASKND